MRNIDYVEKAIDLFEASLSPSADRRYPTVQALGKKIGYSPHYLSQLFSGVCNMSMGQYMLKRRLTEAFLRIRDSRDAIGEIARDLGWDDYSSFSRAFRKEFKQPASAVREQVMMDRVSLTWRARPGDRQRESAFKSEPTHRRIPELHVTGLVFFMDRSAKTFHKAWHMYTRYAHLIDGETNSGLTYQFSSWPEESEDVSEGLWILCAKETAPGIFQDPIFFSKTIEAADVLRFEHAGPIESLRETYAYIWEEYLPQCPFRPKGNHEFQRYGRDPDTIEIMIPIDNL